MSAHYYVYCEAHREERECASWGTLLYPQELISVNRIVDKDAYGRRVREMEIAERGADFERNRPWLERESELLEAFLRRHTVCAVKVDGNVGPPFYNPLFCNGHGPSFASFSFHDDLKWHDRGDGSALPVGGRDVLRQMLETPLTPR